MHASDPWLPQLPTLRPRHIRGCTGKLRYPDKRAALSALNSRTTGHQRRRPDQQLTAYPCMACRGWHLTRDKEDY